MSRFGHTLPPSAPLQTPKSIPFPYYLIISSCIMDKKGFFYHNFLWFLTSKTIFPSLLSVPLSIPVVSRSCALWLEMCKARLRRRADTCHKSYRQSHHVQTVSTLLALEAMIAFCKCRRVISGAGRGVKVVYKLTLPNLNLS